MSLNCNRIFEIGMEDKVTRFITDNTSAPVIKNKDFDPFLCVGHSCTIIILFHNITHLFVFARQVDLTRSTKTNKRNYLWLIIITEKESKHESYN